MKDLRQAGILAAVWWGLGLSAQADLCSAEPQFQPILVDFSRWSVVQYGRWEQGPARWILSQTNTVATQIINADASILLSDFLLNNLQVQGTWRVNDLNDDDLVGFVFGYVDDRHFYLFDWKRGDQFGGPRGFAQNGMSIKRVDASSSLTAEDLWATYPSDTNRVCLLYHNDISWAPYTDYNFSVEFFPAAFTLTVKQGTNVLAMIQIDNVAYPTGRFGLYNSSQEQVVYRAFTRRALPPLPTLSVTDATVVEGTGGATNALFLLTLSTNYCQTVHVNVATADQSATAPDDFQSLPSTPLAFLPGETHKIVSIRVNGDSSLEPAESFALVLFNPVRAVLERSAAQGLILDDDVAVNLPPLVQILEPPDGSTFTVPAVLAIAARATDPDGTVRSVSFLVGTNVLGTIGQEPYRLLWTNDAVGLYTVTALAIDNQGARAASAPVTLRFEPGAQSADVAIVRNFPDLEIQMLQQYLDELKLTWHVFDQEGLSFDQLRNYQLVIWDDLGQSEGGLTTNEVWIFKSLLETGISLYIIGPSLISSGAALPASEQQLWSDLIHLEAAPVEVGPGVITAFLPASHLVTDGPFGTVVSFPYPNRVEPALVSPGVSILLAQSGLADVLVAHEDPASLTRVLAQNLAVFNGLGSCGVPERKRLFKNAVWWLLKNSPLPPFLNLYLRLEQSPAVPLLGQPLVHTITITHNGELAATEVTLSDYLPPELTLLSANASQGVCSNHCGIILCRLGELAQSAEAVVSLTLVPNSGGVWTNLVTVSSNEGEARTSDNSATIVGRVDAPPLICLDVQRLPGEQLRLQVTAEAGRRYVIETSTNLAAWEPLADFVATQQVSWIEDPLHPVPPQRFYRAWAPQPAFSPRCSERDLP